MSYIILPSAIQTFWAKGHCRLVMNRTRLPGTPGAEEAIAALRNA
jgi:hypothetical protein